MTINKNLHWFICILFLLSCARQSSPTGGPKDTIPPTLLKSTPPNEAINFHGNSIELQFSEMVIINAPKEQLIVTPTIGKDYKITARKNVVKLEFEEPLKDSTTYTFNFRETIQDITERNPVRNLSLAYSTGTYIDSLSIEGNVYNLLEGKALADVTVALHPENDTFNILEHPATYFTKTDKNGLFKISHLKPGNYFVYALDDKNRNLIVNARSESYGFKAGYQHLQENIKDVSIGLVRLDAGPLRITSARPYNTYYNIKTSKNLRTFTVTAKDSSDLSYTFGEDQANIRIYDNIEQDSLEVRLVAMDSIDNIIDTTLYAKFLTREVTPEKFDMQLVSSSLMAHTGHLEAVLHFTKPLKELDFDSIYYQVDSLTRVNFNPEDITWEPLKKNLTIRKQIDRKYFQDGDSNSQPRRAARGMSTPDQTQTKNTLINELHLRQAAFISIEQDSSKQIVQPLKPLKEQDLAVIHISIRTEQPAYLVQLLDNSYKVIQEIRNQPNPVFRDLVPGQYQIRLIIDINDNGRWDPGNYFKEIEPEPIVYYRAADKSTVIKGVNANWVLGTDGEMFITY